MADNKTQIVITAEDKTAAAFATAKAGLERFSSAYATLGGLAGVGVAGALVAGIKSVIDLGDEMNDLSQKVGISVKDLATWKLAAEQSGTSLDSVAKGVKGLSQYMVQNGAALREAGITATDANGALVQLADLFKAMPDGVEKTALAVQLFGKAGMDMIPMLNLGSQGLDEARKKAEEYGKKMAELAPMADKFNDVLRELKLQSELTGISFTGRLIEPMTKAAEAIRDARGGAEGLYSAMKKLQELTNSGPLSVFGLIAAGADVAIPRSKGYSGPKNAAGLPMSELEQFDAATEAYMADAPARAAAAEARKRAGGLLDKGATGNGAGVGRSAKTDLDRALDAQKKRLAEINATAGDEQTVSVDTVSRQYAAKDLADLEKLRRKYADLADPLQKYRDQLDQIEKLKQLGREAGGLDAAQALAAAMSVNDAMDAEIAKMNELGKATKEVDNFARDMGLSFASAFEDAVVGGKSLSDVVKGLGQDIERIILRKTVTEPLGNAVSDMVKGGSGGSGGLLGGIKDLFGFASGGAFTVGGAGGTDSQVVAFKATPGEEVTVRTPGQQGGGSSIVIHQSISVDSRSDQASIMQAMVAAKNAALAEMYDRQRRGA